MTKTRATTSKGRSGATEDKSESTAQEAREKMANAKHHRRHHMRRHRHAATIHKKVMMKTRTTVKK